MPNNHDWSTSTNIPPPMPMTSFNPNNNSWEIGVANTVEEATPETSLSEESFSEDLKTVEKPLSISNKRKLIRDLFTDLHSKKINDLNLQGFVRVGSSYEDTVRDIAIQYSGCYGRVGDYIIYLYNIDSDEIEDNELQAIIYQKSDSFETSIKVRDIFLIDWTLPKIGAINLIDTVLFIERHYKIPSPARYRKGFHIDAYKRYCPNAVEYSYMNKNIPLLKLSKTIYSVFNNKYLSFNEAIHSIIEGKRLSSAISDQFYLSLDSSKNKIILWMGTTIIGVLNRNTDKFKMKEGFKLKELELLGINFEEVLL